MITKLSLAEYFGLLGTYLEPQRARVALLAVLLLGSIGMQLVNPQIIRFFIDTAQSGGEQSSLTVAAAAFIAFGLLQRVAAVATSYVGLDVGWSATNALRARLTTHLVRLDMPFHKTHTPGELIERVDGDVTALANFFSKFAISLVGNFILVVAALVLIYRENMLAGVVLTAYAAVTIVSLAALQNFGTRRWAAARQAHAEQYGYIEEHLSGTEDIQGVGAENYVLHGLYGRLRAALRTSRGANLANSLSNSVTGFLYVTGYGLGLGTGAYLYTQGSVTIGTAFLIVLYIGMLSQPLDSIGEQARDLQQASASIGRVGDLLAAQPVVREEGCSALPAGALSVWFSHVSFAYNDLPGTANALTDLEPVLHRVDFKLSGGRVLGILGRTGSGQTTITRLLFRLYDPTEGRILLGGTPLREVAFDDLKSRVGMVTQDVQLFGGTIRDNITFFNPEIGDQAVHRALEELGLSAWVAQLPHGLDTVLGARGAGLSAGEAQLLAFTRVFLRDPGLVILDEAASRLDPITEQRLERAVGRLLTGRTGVIIAHRLRTVQQADDILVLDAGRVVEFGERAALAADPASRYNSLFQMGLEEALR